VLAFGEVGTLGERYSYDEAKEDVLQMVDFSNDPLSNGNVLQLGHCDASARLVQGGVVLNPLDQCSHREPLAADEG